MNPLSVVRPEFAHIYEEMKLQVMTTEKRIKQYMKTGNPRMRRGIT